MSDPVVLRVVRPYASEPELLDAERWTITMKRVVLIGERPLKRGTVVHIELVLENGEKLLRAEGKVLGMAKPRPDRPKGLEVRLKRYGASTRQFLERALGSDNSDALNLSAEEAARDSLPELDSSASRSSDAELDSSPYESPVPDAPAEEPAADEPTADVETPVEVELVSQVEMLPDDAPTESPRIELPESDRSGVRLRIIEPPPDRDALLERLRERARRIAQAKS